MTVTTAPASGLDEAGQREADRIAAVLLAAATEIAHVRHELATATPAERLRWRRVEQVLATAGATIGLPDLFTPPPASVDEVVR